MTAKGSVDYSGKHNLFHSTGEAVTASQCVLSPLGRTRLTWDFVAFLCLLIEFWITPFELIFLSDLKTQLSIRYVSLAINVFFCLDILLNFSTGYVTDDRLVLQRAAIIKEYVRFWLWIDILATLPFDLIMESFGGMLSMAKVGKASKVFKAFRYLKMVRAFRLMKTVKQAGTLRQHFNILGPLRKAMVPLQAGQLVYGYACIWGHTHC